MWSSLALARLTAFNAVGGVASAPGAARRRRADPPEPEGRRRRPSPLHQVPQCFPVSLRRGVHVDRSEDPAPRASGRHCIRNRREEVHLEVHLRRSPLCEDSTRNNPERSDPWKASQEQRERFQKETCRPGKPLGLKILRPLLLRAGARHGLSQQSRNNRQRNSGGLLSSGKTPYGQRQKSGARLPPRELHTDGAYNEDQGLRPLKQVEIAEEGAMLVWPLRGRRSP